jgi:hypothetical protein
LGHVQGIRCGSKAAPISNGDKCLYTKVCRFS